MLEQQAKERIPFLEMVIGQLSSDEGTKLVSITKKINKADPFTFFQHAGEMDGHRSFWANSAKSLWLVGAGCATEIISDKNQFQDTEKQWKQLISDAWIDNPYEVPGTGLVSIGGMAFDPLKEKTDLWESFKDSQFTVPAFLLTIYESTCYLTTNLMVHHGDDAEELAGNMQREEKALLQGKEEKGSQLCIEEKQEIAPEYWKQSIRKATEAIRNGVAEKIVLARELRLTFNEKADIPAVLEKLYETQENSYLFAFQKGEDTFVGATPERLVLVEGDKVLSTCLAGTAPRGKTEEEDRQVSDELFHDEKNRREHQFVVTMIRSALENYCTEVDIPAEPVIYPLKNLQHLYTPVTAKLEVPYSIFDIVEKLHPTPALGGTPKEAALRFIRDNEKLERGWYGAPIGWLDSNHNGEFAVAIRSALVRGKEASLFAGCGVVKDSDPESEYEETKIKLTPMLHVLGGEE